MNRYPRTRWFYLSLALLLLVALAWLASSEPRAPRFALAAPQAAQLDWRTVDGGGGQSSGGGYTLAGTLGQHDAGPAGGMSGGDYQLVGGFWPGVSEADSELYLPVIIH